MLQAGTEGAVKVDVEAREIEPSAASFGTIPPFSFPAYSLSRPRPHPQAAAQREELNKFASMLATHETELAALRSHSAAAEELASALEKGTVRLNQATIESLRAQTRLNERLTLAELELLKLSKELPQGLKESSRAQSNKVATLADMHAHLETLETIRDQLAASERAAAEQLAKQEQVVAQRYARRGAALCCASVRARARARAPAYRSD